MQQRIQRPPELEQPFAKAIPATPCDAFTKWSGHPDLRIADAGEKLRARWCDDGDATKSKGGDA